MLGVVLVPVPVAMPTTCTKKVTSNVQAVAKIISGSVSPTNWHHTGSDHIMTGIQTNLDNMANNKSRRNCGCREMVVWWLETMRGWNSVHMCPHETKAYQV